MLCKQDLNPKLLNAQYAVRGILTQRAQQLEQEGRNIIYCNIGNPHTFLQKPLTYVREILSLVELPELIKHAHKTQLFHPDSISRAQEILAYIPEGTGSYSTTTGIEFIRRAIANFIQKRDNIFSDFKTIVLTNGASEAVQMVLTALIKSPIEGVLVPIPQYPLYNASLALKGGVSIGYYLDEENNWQLNEEALEKSITQARLSGTNPIAITIINPGNPTGAVLSYENIQMVIRFAKKYNLSILADEVYQENIYNPQHKFYSFAKVMHDMQVTDITLFSFHSMSKGYFGECGHRAGYMEVRNIPDDVFMQLVKLQSMNLCANIMGQIATYLMVSPPKPSDTSYNLYLTEKKAILDDLHEKAIIIGEELNKIPGMSVNTPDGAMYAFVKFELPQHILKAHPDTNHLDEMYCLALLEETGICVVPGSGFGQLPGTLHFRITFLPAKEQILELVAKLKEFHASWG
ncbi:MAG: aminotransferase class I/II-fold pyridoxal phosphate-dependent enzyme [Burkholderiales bacterium]|nr:aminotransferase class I/II-fold pyridoxal phosphate-dependent enzyme [Burkholderiales bacterium]